MTNTKTELYNFQLHLSEKQISFLKKYNFKEEINTNIFSAEENIMISDLVTAGILYRYLHIIQGTCIYLQFINHKIYL